MQTWALVVLLATTGLVISVILKHLGNITRILCHTAATILSLIVEAVAEHDWTNQLFLASVIVTLGLVYYTREPPPALMPFQLTAKVFEYLVEIIDQHPEERKPLALAEFGVTTLNLRNAPSGPADWATSPSLYPEQLGLGGRQRGCEDASRRGFTLGRRGPALPSKFAELDPAEGAAAGGQRLEHAIAQ